MKKVLFQQQNVPSEVKEKVMAYINADMNIRPSIIKRSILTRILVPNFLVIVMIVGVISISKIHNDPIVIPVINTTNNIEVSTLSLPVTRSVRIEDKMTETENLMTKLDKLNI